MKSSPRQPGSAPARDGGSYVLLMELPAARPMSVGRLGQFYFSAGCYAYVGSALNGLGARVSRHLHQDKKVHWHIDYLLKEAKITNILLAPSDERTECLIAGRLAGILEPVPGFGCSDCHCLSHLFYAPDETRAIASCWDTLDSLGLDSYTWRHPEVVK